MHGIYRKDKVQILKRDSIYFTLFAIVTKIHPSGVTVVVKKDGREDEVFFLYNEVSK